MLIADYLSWDPVWPWSLPGMGIPALAGGAFLLVGLTVWTYLGVRGATKRRVAAVLTLRLFALLIPFLLVLRPALAVEDEENQIPSKLILLFDFSESMKITDAFNGESRWKDAGRILNDPRVAEALKKLAAAKVELLYYQGAEDLRPFEPDGQPTGKRTDIGAWLNEILQRHGGERNLRGLVLLSDGADNGSRFSTREKAALMRGVCPIFPFGLGKTTTTTKQNDIAFVDLAVEPSPVPIKGKMILKGLVNAPGYEDANVKVSVLIDELDGKGPRLASPPGIKSVQLKKTERNEVVMVCDAPDRPGEIKVTMKIEPLKDEVTDLNNEISTYVSVTTEGVSILWVEGRMWFESPFAIRTALSRDPRFRVYYTEKLQGAPVQEEQKDWYNFDKRHYDVIVIGDIPATRLAEGEPGLFKKIRDKVTQSKTGLVFLGGQQALASGDWNLPAAREIASLLPIEVTATPEPRQIDKPARLVPTDAGLKYLLRLNEDKDKNMLLWKKLFSPLEGMTNLGTVKQTATVLGVAEIGEDTAPALVSETHGGRVVVFGGDTTYKVWRRTAETIPAYERFWKQLMLYAAQQENTESAVWIKLDRRRVPAGVNQRVPFTVGVRGKNGQNVPNPSFAVKVIAPNKEEIEVPIALEGGEYRGYFWKTDLAGEYKIEARAKGKDAEGNELPGDPGMARFLGYAEDLEILRTAADHDGLEKIAQDSGGQFQIADERRLARFLEDLNKNKSANLRPRVDLWPDWRQSLPAGSSASDQLRTLWNSAALPCFLLFATLLFVEWFLRRRWGLV